VAERRRGRRRILLLLGLLGVWFLLGLRIHRVEGTSMQPTFSEGDLIWSVRLWRAPRRGEVVIFEAPDGSGRSMKRVAGVPGDRVATIYERWQPDPARPPIETSRPVWGSEVEGRDALREGEYFLIGDHSTSSLDSRSFGPVSAAAVLGRVLFAGPPEPSAPR
jgi:signal peptidase I